MHSRDFGPEPRAQLSPVNGRPWIAVVLSEPPVDFGALFLRNWGNRLGVCRDAIPEVLSQLDPFGRAQLEQFVDLDVHSVNPFDGWILTESPEAGKEP